MVGGGESVVSLADFGQPARGHIYLICSHSSLLHRVFFCNRNKVTIKQAYVTVQKVMGRANGRLGKLLSGSLEDLRLRAFFVCRHRSRSWPGV